VKLIKDVTLPAPVPQVQVKPRFPAAEGSPRQLGDASRLKSGVQHDRPDLFLQNKNVGW
jgi:hypothetical protein